MIKTLLTLFSVVMLFNFVIGQELKTEDGRYITVTGSAEVNVQPDEIELEIVLQEYGDQYNKTDLTKIEKEFFNVLEKNNISMDKVTFNNAGYYWYYWWTYRNNFYKEKRYNVKLDKTTDFLSLMKDLDRKGVSSLRIAKTTNEQLQTLRKEVKIQSVQAARDKARYLLESIDEKIGRVMAIEEIPDNSNYYWRDNQLSNVAMSTNKTGDELENIATIKLRYEIKAKFEIAE
jgi:uncharacterized protein YggE